jgi:hypothetical protein
MPVLVQVVFGLFRTWNRKYFGLFGKTFGYLYRFLIYGVHSAIIILAISKVYYQLFDFVVVYTG